MHESDEIVLCSSQEPVKINVNDIAQARRTFCKRKQEFVEGSSL